MPALTRSGPIRRRNATIIRGPLHLPSHHTPTAPGARFMIMGRGGRQYCDQEMRRYHEERGACGRRLRQAAGGVGGGGGQELGRSPRALGERLGDRVAHRVQRRGRR